MAESGAADLSTMAAAAKARLAAFESSLIDIDSALPCVAAVWAIREMLFAEGWGPHAYCPDLARTQGEDDCYSDPLRGMPRHVYERVQTPPWSDRAAIRALYDEARALTAATGIPHHVDHEVPLRGRYVSGLHVPANMRILPWRENVEKGNRFKVEP